MDGVGAGYLLFSPPRMPFLQINGISTDADKNAVVEVDAVALHLICNVVLVGVSGGLDGLTGCQA